MADYPTPPDDYPFVGHPLPAVVSEHHFLYGDAPHPRTVAHTEGVVERIHALKPPSLVRMDRAEALVAQVVTWRNLELHGQAPGDQQWDAALAYVRDLADRYIEATT